MTINPAVSTKRAPRRSTRKPTGTWLMAVAAPITAIMTPSSV